MPGYKVTRIRRVTILNQDEIPTPGRRVHFTIDGVAGADWLEYPEAEFDEEQIHKDIQAHVEKVNRLVSGL